jgi:hypothetical protein
VLEFIALGAALEFIVLEFFASVLEFIALVFYRAGFIAHEFYDRAGVCARVWQACRAGSTGDRRERGEKGRA